MSFARLKRAHPRFTLDDLSPRLRAALASAEVPACGCKLSMLPVCLIGVEAGCRQQRRSGNCSCKWRYVPACQFDQVGGCARRRHCRRCDCGRLWMPQCLSPGCNTRRRGKLCGCPRWPGDPCEHITAYASRMRMLAAALTLEKDSPPGSDPDSGWAFLLWLLWPEIYQGPRGLGAPANLTDHETRVAKMEARHAAKLQLRHPDDVLADGGNTVRKLQRNLSSFVNRLHRQKKGEQCA